MRSAARRHRSMARSSRRCRFLWLRALCDQRLAPALEKIRAEPARNWTVAETARGVGMSRTSLAVCFREVTGTAPLIVR